MKIFEWDEEKNELNKSKHGISFEKATEVFDDPDRVEYFDELHSDEEDRWIVIGYAGDILFVVFTERESGNVTRLISARRATAYERREYYGNN